MLSAGCSFRKFTHSKRSDEIVEKKYVTDRRCSSRIQRIWGVIGLRLKRREGLVTPDYDGGGLGGTRLGQSDFDGCMLRLKDSGNSRLIRWELGGSKLDEAERESSASTG